jgi:hypothetical protein
MTPLLTLVAASWIVVLVCALAVAFSLCSPAVVLVTGLLARYLVVVVISMATEV